MNNEQYTQESARTVAPINSALRHRLLNPEILGIFAFACGRFIEASTTMDALKKHIFYGSRFNSQITLPEPSEEEHARITEIFDKINAIQLLHGVLGKCGEAGELLSQLASHLFEECDLDSVNIVEELGDDAWYDEEIFRSISVTRQQVMALNIAKLRARYPDKFTQEAAENRDLVNERIALTPEVVNERSILDSHKSALGVPTSELIKQSQSSLEAERFNAKDENS